jgi:formate dehydrogenase major subunit
MQLTRRGLLKGVGAGAAVSTLGALGFGALEPAAAEVRPYKLQRALEPGTPALIARCPAA